MEYVKTLARTFTYILVFLNLFVCSDMRCEINRLLPEYHSHKVSYFGLDQPPESLPSEPLPADKSKDYSPYSISPSWETAASFDAYDYIDRDVRGYAPEPTTYYETECISNNEEPDLALTREILDTTRLQDAHLPAFQEIWPDELTMQEEFDFGFPEIGFWLESSQNAACSRYDSRKIAYEKAQESPFVFTHHNYELSDDADALLHLNKIDREFFLKGVYNPLQHQMHIELIDILEQTAQLIKHHAFNKEYTPSTDYIVNMTGHGVQFNKLGDIIASMHIADFCCSLIDCGQAVLDGVIDAAIDVADYAINHKTEMVLFGLFPVVMGKYYTAKFAFNVGFVVLDYSAALADKIAGNGKDFDDKQKEMQAMLQNATVYGALRAASGIAARMYFNCKLDRQVIKLAGAGVNAIGQNIHSSIPLSTLNDVKQSRMKRAAHRKELKAKGREKAARKKVLEEQEKVWEEKFNNLSEAERIEELKYRKEPKNIYKIVKDTGERCRIVRPTKSFHTQHIKKWMFNQYRKIRNCKNDIEIIAKNTGMPIWKIKQIKEHLFYSKHILEENKIVRFHPDPEIAAAWNRLYKGDYIINDLALLVHEYAESKYESLFKVDYETAHEKIQMRWFWDHPKFKE